MASKVCKIRYTTLIEPPPSIDALHIPCQHQFHSIPACIPFLMVRQKLHGRKQHFRPSFSYSLKLKMLVDYSLKLKMHMDCSEA